MHALFLICVSQFPNLSLGEEGAEAGRGEGTETIGRLEMSIQESGSGMRGVLFHGLSGPDLHRRPGSS